MAVTFTQEIFNNYPVFNNSWIKFSTSGVPERALITVLEPAELLSAPISIYPNAAGEFTFNLAELAKISFDKDGFNMANEPASGWLGKIESHNSKLTLSFSVTTATGTESVSKTFTFYKGVVQVLDESSDLIFLDINKEIDYFEGFPFSLQFSGFSQGDTIKIKHIGTGIETAELTASALGTFDALSVCVDKGSENFSNTNSYRCPISKTF